MDTTVKRYGPFINGFCKDGHPKIPDNIGRITVRRSGKIQHYPTCRICRAAYQKMKYRTDPSYREKKRLANKLRFIPKTQRRPKSVIQDQGQNIGQGT